jgi:hypothetical protein
MPKATQKSKRVQLPTPMLPRYTELDSEGTLLFIIGDGRLVPLPDDPTTPEFNDAYCAALLERIKADVDIEDLHAAQRRAKLRRAKLLRAKLLRVAIKGLASLLVQDRRARGER